MEAYLLFDAQGECIGEIGGAAVAPAGVVTIARPAGLVGAPLKRLRLINGVPVESLPTPADLAAREEAQARAALSDGLLDRFIDLENRLRVLERQPVLTKAEFISVLTPRG